MMKLDLAVSVFTTSVLRALRLASLLLLAFMAAGAALSYFRDAERLPVFRTVLEAERAVEAPARAAIKSAVPTDLNGKDISFYLVLTALYVLSLGFGLGEARLGARALSLRARLRAKSAGPARHDELDRKALLELYAKTRQSLDKFRRTVAFVSIDVVDSTGMKDGEDPAVAERDFRRYKAMVERVVASKAALKSAWTPDGAMVCFPDVPAAASACGELLAQLEEFNRSERTLRRPFAVRIGLNAGNVLVDETTPMEEMSDRVIDVAGHLQKYGEPNAVAANRDAVEAHLERFAFAPSGRQVDGVDVLLWRPVLSASRSASLL